MSDAGPLPRVVVVAESASAVFGGEAILPLHIFRKLRARGAEAWLVVHARTRDELLRLMPAEAGRMRFIPDTRLHVAMFRLGSRLPGRIAYFTTGYVSRLSCQRMARRIVRDLVREHRADVVHQPVPVSPREPSIMYRLGAPVVMGPMNGGMTYPPAFEGQSRSLRLVGRLTDLGRAASAAAHRLMPGKLRAETLLVANERTRAALPAGVRGRVLTLVENGVDPDTWIDAGPMAEPRPADGPTRFAFVGRLVDWKAVDLLLEAFARVVAEVPATLDIYGDGPMRPELEAHAGRLGLGDWVRFVGWVEQGECARRLRTADALVLPSLYECGGAVVLEAMACRLPVVATDWGGPADYLDPSCGILVPPTGRAEFVAGFAAAMLRLARSPGLRAELGAAGLAKVRSGELNWDVKIGRILDIYRETIAAARPATVGPGSVVPTPAVASEGHGPGPAMPAGPPVETLIVVVNYRSAELAIDCLASLEGEVAANPGTHVVVVENASGPDQADRLRGAIRDRGWSGWATLVVAARNGGFAAGNNVAIAPALAWARPPERFWLLNPDTVVRPGAMRVLVEFLAARPEVGLAGSRLEDPDGTAQISSFRFPSVLGELEGGLRFGPASRLLRGQSVVRPISDVAEATDWVAGASLMVRRDVFDRVGLLDERYFMYYEEVDFCRRARDAGWPCWYVPDSRVVHLVGRSSDVTSAAGATKRRPRYWFDARRLYFLTHHGRVRTGLANLLHVAAFASFRARRRLQRKPDGDPRLMLWDLVRYNFLPVRR